MGLPGSIAPFAVVVTPVNSSEPGQRRAAEEIYQTCLALGLDAILDDRDERPGVKFKDADLVGIPFRITVGKKLAQGMVELVERHGKKSADVPVAEAAGPGCHARRRISQSLLLPELSGRAQRGVCRDAVRAVLRENHAAHAPGSGQHVELLDWISPAARRDGKVPARTRRAVLFGWH